MASTLVNVAKARDVILAEGALPSRLAEAVRPEILTSWTRSLGSGADPTLPELPYDGDTSADEALLRAAEPVLTGLADRLSGLGAGVLLADKNAHILRRWVTDSDIRPELDRIRSDAGFTVNEELIGTNGVGTVAQTGRPVQIVGPEHLAESLTNFTCVGVPIHHPVNRRLEGIITLSCRAEAGNVLLTPLMTSTATDIEHRLLSQASLRERILLDAYLTASRNGSRRVAAVGHDFFMAGPRVTQMLDDMHQVMLWETVRSQLTRRDPVSVIHLTDGRSVRVSATPVTSDREVIGAIVEFGVVSESTVVPPAGSSAAAAPAPDVRRIDLPGTSTAWANVLATTARLVAVGSPFLVVGETGTGKMTLVREAFKHLDEPAGEFVEVNCALPQWTGADTVAQVLESVRAAAPAVVVLRNLEVVQGPVAMSLSSVLQTWRDSGAGPVVVGTWTSVSGEAADPEQQRLLDQISVGRVEITPLRERGEDVLPLATAVLRKLGRPTLRISAGAARALTRAPWPGNVRQLESVLRGALVLARDEIKSDQLPPEIQASATRRDLTALERLELKAILDALQQAGGNKVTAAKLVGISRSTLYRKLRSYRIDPDSQYY
ncbi:MAG: sigma-54-dependent Fis family transcriptional regulator [Candidatus Nanopelagicales bacterium]